MQSNRWARRQAHCSRYSQSLWHKAAAWICFHHLRMNSMTFVAINTPNVRRATYSGDIGPFKASIRFNNIFRRIFTCRCPAFRSLPYILLAGVIHYGQNILDMLFRVFLQLVIASLCIQIDDTWQPVACIQSTTWPSSAQALLLWQ